MPVYESAAGRQQPGRIITKRAQRQGGLLHEQRLVYPGGPGDVTEPLDRVHRSEAGQQHGGDGAATSEDHEPQGSALPSGAVPTDPPADLLLDPINGEARSIDEWLTTFQLAVVILDPFTEESAWILETAGGVLHHFREADCRASFVVTGTADEARQFLGPWADKVMTFSDPGRAVVKALGLNELPAFVHIRGDLHVAAAAQGWDPMEWRAVAKSIAKNNSWSAPLIPAYEDPAPYAGSAAAG